MNSISCSDNFSKKKILELAYTLAAMHAEKLAENKDGNDQVCMAICKRLKCERTKCSDSAG